MRTQTIGGAAAALFTWSLALGAGWLALAPYFGAPSAYRWAHEQLFPSDPPATPAPSVTRVEAPTGVGTGGAVLVAPDVVAALGIRSVLAQPASQTRSLTLDGWLALDPASLARVHSRFPGEVIEVGAAPGTERRPLRPGDEVPAGHLLAVVWSKDLGEKKSELIDALLQLRLDQDSLTRMERLYEDGNSGEGAVRQSRRSVQAARVAVDRAERTLRSWRLSEEEISRVRREADRLQASGGLERSETARPPKDWARVEVRAPSAGTVVEKNITPGDIIDTAGDLFKLADLHRLVVWAHAYEEDLPALLALPTGKRNWTIRLLAEPGSTPVLGSIETIGAILDPTQHTALLTGPVINPGSHLRVGQFVTATVELPAAAEDVMVPEGAVVETGSGTVVFVQVEADRPLFQKRQVIISRFLPGAVYLRGRLSAAELEVGKQAIQPGERVVSAAAVSLEAMWPAGEK